MATSLLLIIFLSLPIYICMQDAFNFPTVLVDVYSGASISHFTLVPGAAKAYGALKQSGDMFTRLMVTDGTAEGTRLLNPFNMTNRGDPALVYPPGPGVDTLKEVVVFNDIFWFTVRDFEFDRRVLWSLNPSDDVARRHVNAVLQDVDYLSTSISEAAVFQDQVYITVDSWSGHTAGLHRTDKYFTENIVFNSSSYFTGIPLDPELPLDAFTSDASILLVTDTVMLIAGSVQSNTGLWAFNGTNFYPINLAATDFRRALHDPQRNKIYFVADVAGFGQLFVHDVSNAISTSTQLSQFDQDCGTRDCFDYINLLNANDGTVVFVYAQRLGFTSGTAESTTLWASSHYVNTVKGLINNRLFYLGALSELTSIQFLVTDGTEAGTKKIHDSIPGALEQLGDAIVFTVPKSSSSRGIYRLDNDDTVTLIRDDLNVTGAWTKIKLPNGNEQLYLNYISYNTIRGIRYHRHLLFVTDGYGAVHFSKDFATDKIPAIFLSNRFLFSFSPDGTGNGLLYMDPAPESYNAPLAPTSGGNTGTSTFFALVVVAAVNLF